MKSPLVSVLMAAKNTENYIAQAIESTLEQTFKDFELIIADDYSTDRTREIASSYSVKDKRIKIIDGSGRGINATRNKMIENSLGMFLVTLDSDDYMHPSRLEKLLNIASKYKKAFVGSYLAYGNSDMKDLKIVTFPLSNIEIRKRLNNPLSRYGISTVGLGHRRIFEYFRYKELYKSSGDWDFIRRIRFDIDIHFENVPEVLYFYRLNETSMTLNFKSKVKWDFIQRINEFNINKGLPEKITSEDDFYQLYNENLFFKISYNVFYILKKIRKYKFFKFLKRKM